jgi:hypothetical protein
LAEGVEAMNAYLVTVEGFFVRPGDRVLVHRADDGIVSGYSQPDPNSSSRFAFYPGRDGVFRDQRNGMALISFYQDKVSMKAWVGASSLVPDTMFARIRLARYIGGMGVGAMCTWTHFNGDGDDLRSRLARALLKRRK